VVRTVPVAGTAPRSLGAIGDEVGEAVGDEALDGASGRLSYGASLTYTGGRRDTNFDVFPAQPVRLDAYWLAGARIGYAVRPGLELFARGSNLFDADYEDAFAYRTEGRALFVGLQLSGD